MKIRKVVSRHLRHGLGVVAGCDRIPRTVRCCAFAANIVALQAAGAKVIVDDVMYFNEGAFQERFKRRA